MGHEGLTRNDLPTPALLVDLDLMEANLERMSAFAREASLALRPHMKTHKCPEIARLQVKAGARGVCVAQASHTVELHDRIYAMRKDRVEVTWPVARGL